MGTSLSRDLCRTQRIGARPDDGGAPVILSTNPSHPSAGTYVLKLHRDARPALGRVMGRLENVTTGEQFMFATADELLACLARDAERHTPD